MALFGCVPPSGGPAVGDSFGGGIFIGKLTINGLIYNIIAAPKATGQPSVVGLYKNTPEVFTGATSTNDGLLIRDNMIAAGIEKFPMQQWCNALTIGGKTDWVLPPKDWMELAYRVAKPTTATNVTTSGRNTSSIPPTTVNYTTTNPAQTPVTALRSGGAQSFSSDYYACATAGTTAGTYLLKRMTTGADYSEAYEYDHIYRAFRCELAA